MNTKGYTVLGWLVWQVVSRIAKRKVRQNRAKFGAAAAVVLVLVLGLAAARSSSD
jgi:predicted PurR-regulated permease PerM